MSLREDNGPYCLVWLGLLFLGAYYTSFAYYIYISPSYAASFFAVTIFPFMLALMILPPLMAFLFTGYLRPTRGKAKMSMLSFSVVAALFFVIFANIVSLNSDILGNNLFVFSSWGIGSAILIAGGFSIVQSYEQSTSPGMLDVSSLHYGPPKEDPEPEIEVEPEPVVEEPEVPETDSDESTTVEPESE